MGKGEERNENHKEREEGRYGERMVSEITEVDM